MARGLAFVVALGWGCSGGVVRTSPGGVDDRSPDGDSSGSTSGDTARPSDAVAGDDAAPGDPLACPHTAHGSCEDPVAHQCSAYTGSFWERNDPRGYCVGGTFSACDCPDAQVTGICHVASGLQNAYDIYYYDADVTAVFLDCIDGSDWESTSLTPDVTWLCNETPRSYRSASGRVTDCGKRATCGADGRALEVVCSIDPDTRTTPDPFYDCQCLDGGAVTGTFSTQAICGSTTATQDQNEQAIRYHANTHCGWWINAAPEVCDGTDNDRSGAVDDNLTDVPSTCLTAGVCAGTVPQCNGAALWSCTYTSPSYEPLETTCDGLDNDCDGAADLGVCKPEVCDGVDNDGNGTADDNLTDTPPPCSSVGVCAVASTSDCLGLAGWRCSYTAAAYQLTETLCDTLDNDCDGAADVGLVGGPASKQQGVCVGSTQVCASGLWVDPLWTSVSGYEAVESSCDGDDNDCDGFTDEALSGPPASNQQGVCAGTLKICSGGGFVDPALSTVAGYQSPETACDGQDNDCDGFTDEGLSAPLSANQQGVCNGSRKVCTGSGGWIDPVWSSLAYYQATETSCDGRDNDCDGSSDNGLTAPLASKQAGVCAGALKVCGGSSGFIEPNYTSISGYLAVESNNCDGLDNDCDGQIDDGNDVDNDGYYRRTVACIATWGPSGLIDCNDADATHTDVCVVFVDLGAIGGLADGSSWTNAFLTLQDGLAAARTLGYDIWVAAGTYHPDEGAGVTLGDTAARFRLDFAAKLYGGFAGIEQTLAARDWVANPTVLSGDLNGDDGAAFANTTDNSVNVVWVTADVVIDGFTVSGGNAPTLGGGISVVSGSTATISHCVVRDNQAGNYGAGVYSGGTPIISDCSFIHNASGAIGGGVVLSTATTISGSYFQDNSAVTGGAIFVWGASGIPTVTDSIFDANTASAGGGAVGDVDSGINLQRCTFTNNSAPSGGAYYTSRALGASITASTFTGNAATTSGGVIAEVLSNLTVTDSLFVGNQATAGQGGAIQTSGTASYVNNRFIGNVASGAGGGIMVNASFPSIVGCSFTGNSANDGGALYLNMAAQAYVTNCSFASNTATDGDAIKSLGTRILQVVNAAFYGQGPGGEIVAASSTVSYTCADGNFTGTNNINLNQDPFADKDGADNVAGTLDDDLRLRAGSACIDSGDNAAVPVTVTLDLDGNPRIANATVDRGAYESP
ncbi:MAG: hypothetical protein HY903_09420 [Deltaproteobacteria bacterium]|nr:hypothetical protein [Deltaproteobacteria bacterium]